MAEPLIRLIGVSVQFGKQQVLSNIHLDIYTGETLALIGESGCGKSVTLKLIVGLLQPTSGSVLFEGQPVAKMNTKELTAMRQRVGFLFQGAALFDSLSVFDNIAFGLRAKRYVDETIIQQIVQDRLQEVGLPLTALKKKPVELSGGMRKRVALARAMAIEPDVILYDEPTTGLDPIMTDVINELMLMTSQRHTMTSIVVTHEMRTVAKVAQRVVMFYPRSRLEAGQSQVLFDGPAEALEQCQDERVLQFIRGEARDRLIELRSEAENDSLT